MEIIKAIGMAEMRKRKRRVFVEQSEKAIVVEMEQSGLPGLLILSCEWGDRSERWAKGRDEIGTAWWLDFRPIQFLPVPFRQRFFKQSSYCNKKERTVFHDTAKKSYYGNT